MDVKLEASTLPNVPGLHVEHIVEVLGADGLNDPRLRAPQFVARMAHWMALQLSGLKAACINAQQKQTHTGHLVHLSTMGNKPVLALRLSLAQLPEDEGQFDAAVPVNGNVSAEAPRHPSSRRGHTKANVQALSSTANSSPRCASSSTRGVGLANRIRHSASTASSSPRCAPSPAVTTNSHPFEANVAVAPNPPRRAMSKQAGFHRTHTVPEFFEPRRQLSGVFAASGSRQLESGVHLPVLVSAGATLSNAEVSTSGAAMSTGGPMIQQSPSAACSSAECAGDTTRHVACNGTPYIVTATSSVFDNDAICRARRPHAPSTAPAPEDSQLARPVLGPPSRHLRPFGALAQVHALQRHESTSHGGSSLPTYHALPPLPSTPQPEYYRLVAPSLTSVAKPSRYELCAGRPAGAAVESTSLY
eukprot:CAMPEP_0119326886 /NCGR_PEP_ID=MMETSP1333-20130426/69505_1 /TAXON_ID=418940 /ORGANISM="Scyphosphaera apsteinii, Strain RCC1455" /LENGTH=417 /DNA_ID=CAMNT_0007335313 /DNA_START=129 /DNA_END=1379 /DNA_ORIENTATION=+